MACDTDLSSKDHIIPDVRGSGESNLGAQQRAFPNFRSMPDLNQIVDFRAASNAGFTHAGPINARVRLDFDFVFNHGRTGLHNFVPLARVVSCEAKSIRADYGAILPSDDSMRQGFAQPCRRQAAGLDQRRGRIEVRLTGALELLRSRDS